METIDETVCSLTIQLGDTSGCEVSGAHVFLLEPVTRKSVLDHIC